MASPTAYAHICNAIYAGVHSVGGPEQVACGATAPRGSNQPNGLRPSIAPLAFLVAVKKAGLRTFDAWAHHPYYGAPDQTPTTRHVGPRAVELGNIDVLISKLTKLYGPKPLWITEYGYQTRPPDEFFGVSWPKQAQYVREAYAIARANPRIDLFTWFLLRDSPSPESWQSGLITANGRKKPAFDVFAHRQRLTSLEVASPVPEEPERGQRRKSRGTRAASGDRGTPLSRRRRGDTPASESRQTDFTSVLDGGGSSIANSSHSASICRLVVSISELAACLRPST
jgi:hypothetical protein